MFDMMRALVLCILKGGVVCKLVNNMSQVDTFQGILAHYLCLVYGAIQ